MNKKDTDLEYLKSQVGKQKFWQLVCNPQHWDVQKKLMTKYHKSKFPLAGLGEVIKDDWTIPKKYKDIIKPGDLGVIRVGIDPRSNRDLRRLRKRRLEPGYYATVSINEVFFGPTQYPELFNNPSQIKEDWRIKISINQNYIKDPLTIKRLKKMKFEFDRAVFKPIQGVPVFEISGKTFDKIHEEFGELQDTWFGDVKLALKNLGGSAHLKDIYGEVFRIRDGNVNNTYTRTIQRELEENSSDSKAFKKGNQDTFCMVQGKGMGVWGLKSETIGPSKFPELWVEEYQKIIDQDDISSGYEKKVTVHKSGEIQIIRTNPKLINQIKKEKNYTCEACGFNYEKVYGDYSDKKDYIEAHHIEPKSIVKEKAEINKKLKRSAKDFAILCANCHRMIHRMMAKDKGRIIKLKEFKKRIKEEFKKKIKELK